MTRGAVGRTRLYTRRQRRRRTLAVVLALAIGVATVALAGVIVGRVTGAPVLPRVELRGVSGGEGGLLGLPTSTEPKPRAPRFPVGVAWPINATAVTLVGVALWLPGVWLLVRPLLAGLRAEVRHEGLAHPVDVRRILGAVAARRATRYTMPTLGALERWLAPMSACGFPLGRPVLPTARVSLWADWEQRIRIVARPGWGKTTRLLVPIIRALPGPALVSSTEPAIFESTVMARAQPPRRTRWRGVDAVLARARPKPRRPVAVADFSDPDHQWAAGYPQVRWNPVAGCDDFAVAHRRADALLGGVRTQQGRGDGNDRFFRDSATEVLAAWLHAAALGGRGVDDLTRWLRRPTDPTPTRILDDHPRAEASAAVNLAKHLDPRAAKTSSGVERYLTLAANALTTREGRAFCGVPDPVTGEAPELFDMHRHLAADGTVYVLADPGRVSRVRPLLSLFVAEMFLAAEQLALRQPGKRLQRPFIAVLDELRDGVTAPNLPYVATAQRKHGIGFVYAVQSSSQEDAVYGGDAQALRDAAGVTVIGGIDVTTARELADRAGTTPVVTPTHAPDRHTEQIAQLPALTVADQQRLPDGHAVVLGRGLAPLVVSIPSTYDDSAVSRALRREAAVVNRRTAAARAADAAVREQLRNLGVDHVAELDVR